MDEAEGFLLEHAVFSPPRTWPPLAPEPIDSYVPRPRAASDRLAGSLRKVDWEAEAAAHPHDDTAAALDLAAGPSGWGKGKEAESGDDEDSERCVICLMGLKDRTAVGVCGHEFCVSRAADHTCVKRVALTSAMQFECIGVWANQSRRCPLCSADMSPFLLHDLDRPVPTKVSFEAYGPACSALTRSVLLASASEPDFRAVDPSWPFGSEQAHFRLVSTEARGAG